MHVTEADGFRPFELWTRRHGAPETAHLSRCLCPPGCRIVSTSAPQVVEFRADDSLAPGSVEWANYVKVRTTGKDIHESSLTTELQD